MEIAVKAPRSTEDVYTQQEVDATYRKIVLRSFQFSSSAISSR